MITFLYIIDFMVIPARLPLVSHCVDNQVGSWLSQMEIWSIYLSKIPLLNGKPCTHQCEYIKDELLQKKKK